MPKRKLVNPVQFSLSLGEADVMRLSLIRHRERLRSDSAAVRFLIEADRQKYKYPDGSGETVYVDMTRPTPPNGM